MTDDDAPRLTLDVAERIAFVAVSGELRRLLEQPEPIPLGYLSEMRHRLRSGEWQGPLVRVQVALVLDAVTRRIHEQAGAEHYPLDVLPDAPDDLSALSHRTTP